MARPSLYFQLDNGVLIGKGNFAQIFAPIKDEIGILDVFTACLEAEKIKYIKYDSCLNNVRKAIEAIACDIETKSRIKQNGGKYGSIRRTVQKQCAKKSLRAEDVILQKYPELDEWMVKQAVYSGNDGSHAFSTATVKDTVKEVESLFHIALAVYGNGMDASYSEDLCPYGDYCAIPAHIQKEYGMCGDKALPLYIKEESAKNGKKSVAYYLLRQNSDDDSYRRGKDISRRIWNDRVNSPMLLIDSTGEGMEQRDVYSLPGRPHIFDAEYAQSFADVEKKYIAKYMVDDIVAIHSADPPIPHRGIRPENYLICDTESGFRPVLLSMDTAKDFMERSYTVALNREDIENQKEILSFSAPEILTKDNYDELKADVYSVGKMMCFLFTGNPDGKLDPNESISRYADAITAATQEDPGKRATIKEVAKILDVSGKMTVGISAISSRGKRRQQEDALYVSGKGVIQENLVSFDLSESLPVMIGVFDGMGSSEDGAGAALAAANILPSEYERYGKLGISDCTESLKETAQKMEEEVCRYIEDQDLDDAYTTMVVAALTGQKLSVANMGDSRAYIVSKGGIKCITEDHRHHSFATKKGELYQYLGVTHDRKDVVISPYIRTESVYIGDRILICSDGLTDVVSDQYIERTISKNSREDALKKLYECAGGDNTVDNITIVIIEFSGR